MSFTENDIGVMLAESRETRKCIRKLSMLRKTVATHRVKELRHLRAVEKLAAWRRSNCFDRYNVHDGQWVHSPLPPTREETTARLWADVNALRKETSIPEKERPKQRVESFLNELEQEISSLKDEELARLERMITEKRSRAAVHVVVALIGTSQPSNSQSRCSEISFDVVHVCMEGNPEGRMDPESGELEPSSAGTSQLKSLSAGMGFEAPGQQCLSNWEMEQTSIADGCLLVGVSSNLGENIFSVEELVISLPRTRSQPTKKASRLITVGMEGSHHFEKRMKWYYFLFLGNAWAWTPGLFLLLCLFTCFVPVSSCLLLQKKTGDDHFFAS